MFNQTLHDKQNIFKDFRRKNISDKNENRLFKKLEIEVE